MKLAISRMIALFAPLESYFLLELVTQAAIDICTFSLGNIFDVYWQLLMLLKASQPHCPQWKEIMAQNVPFSVSYSGKRKKERVAVIAAHIVSFSIQLLTIIGKHEQYLSKLFFLVSSVPHLTFMINKEHKSPATFNNYWEYD